MAKGSKRKKNKRRELVSLNAEELRAKLKLRKLEAKKAFDKKYPYVEKYLRAKGLELENVRSHSAKVLGAGALTSALLLSPPSGVKALPTPQELVEKFKFESERLALNTPENLLADTLETILPERVRPLTEREEKLLEKLFEEVVGIKAKATLEGEHLNTTYGRIGAEQHLKRFPGDSLALHSKEPEALEEGIAPGLGAWGYFARTKAELSKSLAEAERWYAVVQTLYLPDWGTRQPYLRDWYKYRKVLIVNTQNGKAVVASIADSGPAAWTGKHFGGSPEVMDYLGGPRYKKGPVVLFFVDDPENKIPLGPVEYSKMASVELTSI